MELFEWIVLLLALAVVLSGIARRIGAPYPALLALGGMALAFVPGGPRLTLDPGLALALFVAPVLLDAAFDASLRDLRRNWAPLTGLVVVAVGLTSAGVALVARHLRPEMSWAVAVVLGAIVAPPDAAAATAVLHQVKPPHRVMVILEGESLFNDATALLVYRVGVAAATVPGFSLKTALPLSMFAVVGSVIAGWLLAKVLGRVMRVIRDGPSSIITQFVTTFGVWLLAERLHLSGVLTIVVYAITIARTAGETSPAALRVPAFAVWETVVVVLNVLAFVLIGLQIGPILERLSPAQRASDLRFAVAVLATVVVVRIVWILLYDTAVRWKFRHVDESARRSRWTNAKRSSFLVAWSGMRGIVTLAAALALPSDFPQRDLLVLTAFAVVLGTLLVQGLSLKPLVRLLDIEDDGPVDREITLAWTRGLEAAIASLDGEDSAEGRELLREYRAALELARSSDDGRALPALPTDELRRRSVAAARDTIATLRQTDAIGDDAYRVIQEQLDRLELSAAPR